MDGCGPSDTVSCTLGKEDKVDATLAIEGRHINYQAAAKHLKEGWPSASQ